MRRLTAPVVLLGIAILIYWRLVLTGQFTWLDSPDLAQQVLPWFQFQAQEWNLGRIPLWDPYSWGGQTLFGQGQPGAAYPFNWILFHWPLENGKINQEVLDWYYVLIRYGAAVTAYLLCRGLGRSRMASLLGGCIYAFGGYMAITGWPQMVNGAVWSPLVFLFLFRCVRGERMWSNALLSGCFLGIGWLAGHHQMNLLVSIAAAGVWLWAIATRSQPRLKLATVAAAALVVGVLASGLQTIPEAEYGQRAVRWVGSPVDPVGLGTTVPYAVHELYSATPAWLMGTFIPGVGNLSGLFVGVAAVALCLLGIAVGWRQSEVRWLAVIALCGLLYCLGPWSLLHGALYSLAPLVNKARVPLAGALLFTLAAGPLAAFGLDALSKIENAAKMRFAERAVFVAGALMTIAAALFSVLKTPVVTDARFPLAGIGALLLAAVMAGCRKGAIGPATTGVAIVMLSVFELSGYANYSMLPRGSKGGTFVGQLSEHEDVFGYLAGQPGWGRVEVDDSIVTYMFGESRHMEAMFAGAPSVPSNVWGMGLFSEKAANFFSLRYAVRKAPQRKDAVEVFAGANGVNVYESPHAFPRAWAVHRLEAVPAKADAQQLFGRAEFDPRTTAFVMGADALPRVEQCPDEAEKVEVTAHDPNRVRIQAFLLCPGVVVVNDAWFPGWRAKLDGQATEILEIDGGVRGVAVGAGLHEIDMAYRPVSVMAGAAMTLSALLLTICVWWGGRPR